MTDFIAVTPDFAVAPQITKEDIARAAQEGFKRIINNRPDGEAPGQMTSRDAAKAAADAGLEYYTLPFAGAPPADMVEATATLLEEAERTLAFCRSGTRSITVWAFAQAKGKLKTPDELIALAAAAGYDLGPHKQTLVNLAAG
ncbi:MAG: TIGR01244 family sulfur transferase [Caulobacterales bacterium]